MEQIMKVFFVVYLLQSEVLSLPLSVSDVLKTVYTNEDQILLNHHHGLHLSLRLPNILKPINEIKKLHNNVWVRPFQNNKQIIHENVNSGGIHTMPKQNMHAPQIANIYGSHPEPQNRNSISDTRTPQFENVTRDTDQTENKIEVGIMEATQSNIQKSDPVKSDSSHNISATENTNKDKQFKKKQGISYFDKKSLNNNEYDGMIIFRDDENEINFNGKTTTDYAGDSSTTEEYETTTFEDDTFNRMGNVPPAVVASLLG